MKIGFHDFTFQLDRSFFEEFDNAPISDGALQAVLNVEKKTDHLVLDIDIKGSIQTECNRCTDEILFPVSTESEFLVKFDDLPREEEEIIYIDHGAQEFNCGKIIYDMVILAVPLMTTCDDAVDESGKGKTCNKEVLDRLYQQEGKQEEKDQGDEDNPFSKALKNLKLN